MSIKLLSTDEVGALLGVRPGTLRIWRMKGEGPLFRKIGARVAYAEPDVLAYLDSTTRSSTSQKAAPSTLATA